MAMTGVRPSAAPSLHCRNQCHTDNPSAGALYKLAKRRHVPAAYRKGLITTSSVGGGPVPQQPRLPAHVFRTTWITTCPFWDTQLQ